MLKDRKYIIPSRLKDCELTQENIKDFFDNHDGTMYVKYKISKKSNKKTLTTLILIPITR